MKKERLFHVLGLVDEDLINEAEDKKTLVTHKSVWKKWTAVAACGVLLIAIGAMALQNHSVTPPNISKIPNNNPQSDIELPVLTIDIDGFFSGGMGFEGYAAYDISELKNANPWTEDTDISHLPVFKNVRIYDGAGITLNPDIETMKKRIIEIASTIGMDTKNIGITNALGMDTKNIENTDDYPDEETIKRVTEKYAAAGEKVPTEFFIIERFFMQDNDIKLEVDSQLVATIWFDPTVSLPKEYNFTYYSSYEDTLKTAEYLQKEYASLINMNESQINISEGNYTYDGKQGFSIEFYDNSSDITEKIINYNFNKVTFACDGKGELYIARIYKPDLSQKIGDYPIITPQQAKEFLIKGNYITTVPETFPGEKYIKKTELIYRTGNEQIYLPYYRIYVEIPTMKLENGLNTYGAFYVPAVEEKYISNMPIWDGSFN